MQRAEERGRWPKERAVQRCVVLRVTHSAVTDRCSRWGRMSHRRRRRNLRACLLGALALARWYAYPGTAGRDDAWAEREEVGATDGGTCVQLSIRARRSSAASRRL
jgi:hypothetical protein